MARNDPRTPQDGSGPERTPLYGEGLRALSIILIRTTRKRIPPREGMLPQPPPPCRGPSSVAWAGIEAARWPLGRRRVQRYTFHWGLGFEVWDLVHRQMAKVGQNLAKLGFGRFPLVQTYLALVRERGHGPRTRTLPACWGHTEKVQWRSWPNLAKPDLAKSEFGQLLWWPNLARPNLAKISVSLFWPNFANTESTHLKTRNLNLKDLKHKSQTLNPKP